MGSLLTRVVVIAVGVVLLGGCIAWWMGRDKGGDEGFRTGKVSRGDLLISIGATGTLKPQEEVDVGAQVAGQIASFGTDAKGKPVDYRSEVEPGMVLAQLDDEVYVAEQKTAAAQLALMKAGVTRAERDLDQLNAKLLQAQRDWDRAQKLGPSDALAQASYDAYQSTFEQAKANVEIGKASIVQAKAQVQQAEASLQRADRNLAFTVIKSPVKGVIIDRRVNIGQTVVASLNAPSLFLIATDLRKLEVWVSVNEADIGKIREGQPVTFTVDAYPGEQFKGVVSKVRLNAQMTQNVVTYTVEVTTENESLRLVPYLTASVRFEVDRRDDALLVPTAALRFQPKPEHMTADARAAAEKEAAAAPQAGGEPRRRRREGGGGGGEAPTTAPAARRYTPGTVWVREGALLKPVQVRAGLSDGVQTEIVGDNVTDGMEVVLGELVAQDQASAGTNTNPFGPPQFGRRPGGSSSGGGGGSRGGGGGR